MSYSTEQVIAAAPDVQVAAAGKKLADAKHWRNLGRDAAALWGECQGSAVYQVRVSLADLGSKCSCPSRKFPCKHGIGLLLLAAQSPRSVGEAEQPEWVASWLAKRDGAAARKAKPAAGKKVDAEAQAKRAATRHERVLAGLDALDLWMNDLVRTGLAELETKGTSLWEREAARLVDAQAPALASRLRMLAALPGSPDWAERLLGELGRIALLTHAYRRLDQLAAPVAADVRAAIGWTLTEDEVMAHGDTVADDWLILGSVLEDDDRVRLQRTWLTGIRSGRTALVLQFAAGAAGFAEVLLPGTVIDADLTFWPSAQPQRALIAARRGNRPATNLAAHASCAAMLDAMATMLAAHPWLRHAGVALEAVVPIAGPRDAWSIRDREGDLLPLAGNDHWRMLALSGGAPIGITAEWDGTALTPLAAVVDGVFHRLGGAA
jgi:hypothetical protein